MPEIKFYLPGFTKNLNINLALVESMNNHAEWYCDNIKIASFFGSFPNAIWNGGRCEFGKIDLPRFEDIVGIVNSLGIAIRYTFTNCLIKEEHLSDEYCNRLMSICNNGMNEILVNSPLLESYLRTNYPRFKYILSTTSLTRGIQAINEACNNYDLVVADYRDVRNNTFLEGITSREKVEILLNEACLLDCIYRGPHYEDISRSQLNSNDIQAEKMCRYHNTSRFREAYISNYTLYDDLVPMGYCNFKIRGREMDMDKLLNEYLTYLVKTDFRSVVCDEIENNLMNNC